MNTKVIYANLLLLSIVIGLSYSEKSCSGPEECKFGRCVDGICMCNFQCKKKYNGRDRTEWVCLKNHKEAMSRCTAINALCVEEREGRVASGLIHETGKKFHKKEKKNFCAASEYSQSSDEFCHDQSYCGNAGICIMNKHADGSERQRTCICKNGRKGERCLEAQPGHRPAPSGKPTVGLIVLIVSFGVICIVTIALIVRRCRTASQAGHTSLDEVGTDDGSSSCEKESNRSSHVLGESAPLWK